MDEITIDDKTYISSKRAAAITGYAKDYVGQLCREGRVEARLIGRSWYVLEESIRKHRFETEESTPDSSPELDKSSEITSKEAVWSESVYIPEKLEMLPVKEEEEEKITEGEQDEAQVDFVNESAVEAVEQSNSSIEEEGAGKDEDSSEVEPESKAAWESWFSADQEVKQESVEQPLITRVESYMPYTEEKEPIQQVRINKNTAFDIGAIEPEQENASYVVKEKRVRKPNYLVIKALAFAAIVLFVALALIGTGVTERLGSSPSWGILNILGGTSIIN